jgi:NhaA family Na+:H+ antiporter
MPLFALANAGFPLGNIMHQLGSMVVLGIVSGLFFGKQIGVFGFSWLLIRLKFASLPGKCSWRALYGVSLLCGIGFTMSLFLGTLSFQGDSIRLIDVRLGVLVGSILSGVIGAFVLLGKEKLH